MGKFWPRGAGRLGRASGVLQGAHPPHHAAELIGQRIELFESNPMANG